MIIDLEKLTMKLDDYYYNYDKFYYDCSAITSLLLLLLVVD